VNESKLKSVTKLVYISVTTKYPISLPKNHQIKSSPKPYKQFIFGFLSKSCSICIFT